VHAVYSANRTLPLTAKRLKQLEEHGDGLEPITRPVEFIIESPEEVGLACCKVLATSFGPKSVTQYRKAMAELGDREPEE
jgi:hypothetical protein